MALHRGRQRLDIRGRSGLAPRLEPPGLARQNLQPRLEAMGEIGGLRAGLLDPRVAGVEKAVDLAREWLHLVGEAGPEPR